MAVRAKRADLPKAEVRIRTLLEQLADGAGAEYVRQRLDELAAGAKALKVEIAGLEAAPTAPVELPSPTKCAVG